MSSISTRRCSRTPRPSTRTTTSNGRPTTAAASTSTTARRPTGKESLSLELGVQPHLHGVGLQEAAHRRGNRVVVEWTDGDGDDQVAIEGDREPLGEALAAVLFYAVEPGAAAEIGDPDALALRHRHEIRVEQIDVGNTVDFRILDHAGRAVGAEAELGPDIDLGVVASPGPAGREGIARERPANPAPAGLRLVAIRLGKPCREGSEARHRRDRTAGERRLDDGAAGDHLYPRV